MFVSPKRAVLGCLLVGIAAGAAVVVEANVTHPNSNAPILVGAQMPTEVRAAFERSCQDCHSENTYWPLYSKIPIVSSLVQDDVARGRKTMNLSHWQDYSRGKKFSYLAMVQASIKRRAMPPIRYTALHFNAKLAPAEIDAIEKWSGQEMQRLRHAN
jgi:Haem-binding domain